MARAVELHPLVILTALLVGSELLGVTGAFLAIPVAATLAVLVDEIRRERLRSEMSGASTAAVAADDRAREHGRRAA
jgi:predicted PurR-regulated permease PerM